MATLATSLALTASLAAAPAVSASDPSDVFDKDNCRDFLHNVNVPDHVAKDVCDQLHDSANH